MSPQRYRPASPQIISETLEGEAVIIDLDSGTYYSLDALGSRIWDLLRSGVETARAAEDLAERFEGSDAELAGAVEGFAARLVAEGLLGSTEDAPPASVVTEILGQDAGERAPLEGPSLTRYTDIQDLLMLDPIHEVEEGGWPQT